MGHTTSNLVSTTNMLKAKTKNTHPGTQAGLVLSLLGHTKRPDSQPEYGICGTRPSNTQHHHRHDVLGKI